MRAIVTGAAGQDGTILCANLRASGVDVISLGRPGTSGASASIDLTDQAAVASLICEHAPDQIFHLAACHHSSEQSGDPSLEREMTRTNFLAAEVLIAAVAEHRPACRILLAGSSQMYRATPGETRIVDESTQVDPASFYGRTKAWSRDLLAYYRDHRGVFGSMMILFNHESPRRAPRFVTRKITMAAARAKRGDEQPLDLMDVASRTDWSSAVDVVEGMRLALVAPDPVDYVLGSGVARSVSDLLDVAFGAVGLDWHRYVRSGPPPSPLRGVLVADASRARQHLAWQPRVTFETMIREMVEQDLALLDAAGQ